MFVLLVRFLRHSVFKMEATDMCVYEYVLMPSFLKTIVLLQHKCDLPTVAVGWNAAITEGNSQLFCRCSGCAFKLGFYVQ